MRRALTLGAIAVLAALAVTGSLSAATGAAKTSLTITALGKASGLGGPTSGTFNLVGANAATTDSGRLTFTAPTNALPRKTADGLAYTPMQLTETLKGKHGTLVIRSTVRLFDVVKEDDVIATGTWSILRGTGKYAGLKGGGALVGIMQFPADAASVTDHDFSYRYQGMVTGA